MPSISLTHEVPFGHRLMFHKGKCKYPHGHNYLFEVKIFDELDEHGMVRDFSELKDFVRNFFVHFDHAFVLYREDPFIEVLSGKLVTGTGVILLPDFPAKVVILNVHPTAENLAVLVCDTVARNFGPTIVKCWEQRDCCAEAASHEREGRIPVQIVNKWEKNV